MKKLDAEMALKHTQEQLVTSKKTTLQKFLQRDIQKKLDNFQKCSNSKVKIAKKCDTKKLEELSKILRTNIDDKMTTENIFKSLETKEDIPKQLKPIKPVHIKGTSLEFPKLNLLIKTLYISYYINYEKK